MDMLPPTLRRAVASALLLPLAACAAPSPDAGVESAQGVVLRQVAPAEAVRLPDVVGATRRLGATLLAAAPADGNVVTSPASFAVALGMLTEGARGTTLDDLEAVLGASGEDRRDAFAALRGAVLRLDGDPAVVRSQALPDRPLVHLADQVVVDDGYPVSADYLTALADGFGAGVQRADLASASGKAVLDAWADHHTGGLVKQSAIQPSTDLRVVLQDAILLAARWSQPFTAEATAQRPFTLPDGSIVQTETMASLRPAATAELDGWRAARLPYAGGEVHADLLLPPVGTDPATAPADLLARLAAALDGAEEEQVDLTLPTLDIAPRPLDLTRTLVDAGAGGVMCANPGADLGGIGPESLCVSQAVQQATLTLDEEGTVAAAVTEIGMAGTSAPLPAPELHFDRPFLMVVAHAETSWPLFLAAVRDPRH